MWEGALQKQLSLDGEATERWMMDVGLQIVVNFLKGVIKGIEGLVQESNPGPFASQARIILLDQPLLTVALKEIQINYLTAVYALTEVST